MLTAQKSADGPFSVAERVMITVPVLMASLLHAVNMSTAYVALPNIQGNLSARPDQVGWIITAFVVATAVGTVLTGWLSGRFGGRRVFLGSIVGFTFTSALCGLAGSLEELVFYRVLQGFVSAPLLPISQAIMLDTYPRRLHGFAMSIWSLGMILGPILGPTLGAMLTEFYGWRHLFSMNIPLGVAAYFAIVLTLPESISRRRNLDWVGVISLVMGVSFLQLLLDRGERLDWFHSTEIVLEGIVAATSIFIFVVHSLTHPHPYINLAIFKDRNFLVGLGLIFMFGIAVFASLFILPLFLQNVQNYPVLSAGWVVSVRGVGTMLAMLMGGPLADRFPAKYLILTGLVCVGLSHIVMTRWTSEVELETIIWVTLVNGYGMGMMWVTLTMATFSTLAQHFRVEGAALFALFRSIGASMGTSVIVAILVRTSQINYIEMRNHINSFTDVFNSAGAISNFNLDTPAGIALLQRLVLEQAEMVAFLNAFVFLVVIAFFAMPLVFLFRKPPSGEAG